MVVILIAALVFTVHAWALIKTVALLLGMLAVAGVILWVLGLIFGRWANPPPSSYRPDIPVIPPAPRTMRWDPRTQAYTTEPPKAPWLTLVEEEDGE